MVYFPPPTYSQFFSKVCYSAAVATTVQQSCTNELPENNKKENALHCGLVNTQSQS